jgi:O-antigen biosynthesis protein
MQYNPPINLNDENTMPHTRVIQLTGIGKNVLDVGCARGNTGTILTNQFNCTVSGIEFDPFAADVARQTYREVIVGDVETLSIFSQLRFAPYEVIIFGDVLEHLRAPELVLKTIKSLLTPDGYILVSIPNIVTLRLRLRFLLGQFEYTDQGIMDRTHLRFFTLKTAREMIQRTGYAVAHFEFLVGHNFGRRLKRLRIPKQWLVPSIFGTQFIFKIQPVKR